MTSIFHTRSMKKDQSIIYMIPDHKQTKNTYEISQGEILLLSLKGHKFVGNYGDKV